MTLQQAATAASQLGSRYEITTHRSGARQALKEEQSAASTATVHLNQDGNATTFHVHGGGLVISRMVHECGIAKKVAATIEGAFAARPPADAAELTTAAPSTRPSPRRPPSSQSRHEKTGSLRPRSRAHRKEIVMPVIAVTRLRPAHPGVPGAPVSSARRNTMTTGGTP